MAMTRLGTAAQAFPSRLCDALAHAMGGTLLKRPTSPRRVWSEVALRANTLTRRAALRVALHSGAAGSLLAEHSLELRRLPHYRAEYFPPLGPTAWLDRDDAAQRVAYRVYSRTLTPRQADACLHFAQHGYVLLRELLDPATLDDAWAAYEGDICAGHTPLQPPPRHDSGVDWTHLMNTHHYSSAMAKLLRSPELLRWVQLLLGHPATLVQSIASRYGREPPVHTDAPLITSFPLGQVVAAAIAFEDCDTSAGPLQIYPGTHRLPYVMSHHVGIAPREPWLAGYTGKYEPHMQALLEKHAPAAYTFVPRQGDVLLYHQNLMHAGTEAQNPSRTRHALVAHYISRGAIAYQDMRGRLLGIY